MSELRWVAMCDEFHSPPFPTEEQAERRAAAWDHMGNCPLEHKVVEVRPDERGIYRYPDGRMVER